VQNTEIIIRNVFGSPSETWYIFNKLWWGSQN